MNTSQLTSVSKSLSNCAKELKDSLDQLTETSFQQIFSYDLDCSIASDFVKLITSIESQDGQQYRDKPAVYWFEITSPHTTEEIYRSVIDLKEVTKLNRTLPAYKKELPRSKLKTLYVGKVNHNLAGRMLAHIGHDKSSTAQGLQLCHWTKKEGLRLRLNVIYFPQNLVSVIGAFEVKLAKKLQPILGKHR